MTRPEVLAPAGSWASLKAAAAAGADAVYFGGQSFNARRNADNFSDEEITRAVAFCHARGMKTYITFNTILLENEFDDATAFGRLLCEAGVDAVIVQDLGLARLLRTAAPGLRLHASTQMSVHDLSGVRLLAQAGFSRAVVARELSKEEIARICAQSPIEIEVFVHGALCMSVSGQCYLSAMLGGRSGNRGLCAQPCRLPFSAPGGTGHDLSLKDLSLIRQIGELTQLSVSSLKIEGRMKRPEYVALATKACLLAAKGERVPETELATLRSVFSRGGFTQGYYEGALGRAMFGTRGHEDVLASQGALGELKSLCSGEPPRIGVSFSLKAAAGESVSLSARDTDGNTAAVTGMIPEPARTKATDEAFVKDKLSKTGGTPFYADTFSIALGEGLAIPASELNRMRREALDSLLELRMKPRSIPFKIQKFSTIEPKTVENRLRLRIRLRCFGQLTGAVAASESQLIFLPAAEIVRHRSETGAFLQRNVHIGAELPRVLFGNPEDLARELRVLKSMGITDLLCGNPGTIRIALENGFAAHADFGLNVTNRLALKELFALGAQTCVLSFENTLANLSQFAGGDCGLIAYGRLPLMLTRNCPLKNGAGCARCMHTLTDRRGGTFPVICGDGYSELLNDRPVYMCDRRREIIKTGVRFAVLYFTTETPEETDAVLKAWQNGLAPEGLFTRGLYMRGVL